jgi:hypothetical protein
METVYEIAKWKSVFENAESRKLKTLNWVSVPVGFNSSGYQALIEDFGDQAPALYGAWIALAQVASSCPVRGVLGNSRGKPLKVSHIARMTGFDQALFETLFAWASSPDIQWLVVYLPQETAGNTEEIQHPETPGDSPDDSPTRQEKTPNEGKGREGNNREENSAAAAACEAAAAADVDLFFDSVDLVLVRQQATELKAACPALDRDFVWRSCSIASVIDPEIIPRFVSSVRKREIGKPESYLDTLLREELAKLGHEYRSVKKRAPPTPPPALKQPDARSPDKPIPEPTFKRPPRPERNVRVVEPVSSQ